MKSHTRFFIVFTLLIGKGIASFSAPAVSNQEMLLSIPYLSDKNATIIDHGLKSMNGILSIQVCFELKVMIISFEESLITQESIFKNIQSQEINSTIDLLHASDIPQIKSKYEIKIIK